MLKSLFNFIVISDTMSDQKDLNVNFGFTDCPLCSDKMDAINKTIDIPNYGETLIFTLICKNCNYKITDLYAVYEKEPKRFILKYDNVNQLKHKFVRSSTCDLKIPELGIEIQPSTASDGYITNIEGVLQRIKDVTSGLIKTLETDEQIKNGLAVLQKIDLALEGKFNFTLIIEDPMGNSALIAEFPDDSMKEEPLDC